MPFVKEEEDGQIVSLDDSRVRVLEYSQLHKAS